MLISDEKVEDPIDARDEIIKLKMKTKAAG